VHIGQGKAVSVIIVGGLIILRRIRHHPVFKADPALAKAIDELEVMEHSAPFDRAGLLLFPPFQLPNGEAVLRALVRRRRARQQTEAREGQDKHWDRAMGSSLYF